MEKSNYESIAGWILFFLIVSAVTAKKVVQVLDAKADFKNKMKPIAADEQARSGIDPNITITQAAHESGWGQSGLTQKANNLFGFTGESWAAAGKPVINMPTQEFVDGEWITVQRPFRSYGSWAESVRDWGTLISTASRYSKAYAFAKQGNMTEFAKAVKDAGYATDPNYDAELVAVYNKVISIPDATA